MKNKLNEIIENKFQEVEKNKQKRDFLGSISNPKTGDISIIAEIKLASPTIGRFADKNSVLNQVIKYERGRTDAISVVVDKKYFGGELEFIKQIKNVVSVPILAKDFIIGPYQIYELKAYGADAILLIAKIISAEKLDQFVRLAMELNMEPIVEVQTRQELNNALKTDTRIIAVNARNLESFDVNIDDACKLLKLIPKKYRTLGFSGIKNRKDVQKYKNAGAKGVLVGTSLMKSIDIKGLLMSLRAT